MIEKVRLVNIQSFKDISFVFSNNTVNVFEAPNETGKSILFKIMRLMCDANWYGRGKRDDFIRNGCKKGIALFIVKDNNTKYRIQFEIYQTYQIYKLYNGSELIGSWKEDSMPAKLYQIFKWSYDPVSKRLLNLCDQELDMPFTGSNGKTNFDTMNFIFNNPRLNVARDRLSDWIKELDMMESTVSTKQSSYYAVSKSIEYVDTASLKLSIHKREKILEEVKVLNELMISLNGCIELVEPEFDVIDCDEVSDIIVSCDILRGIGLTLQEIVTMKKPVLLNDISGDVDNIIESVKVLNSMRYEVDSLLNYIIKGLKYESLVRQCDENIHNFEHRYKICPLCGNEF